ncbi:DNA-directed RNA polymerase sigma-70 factor [Bacteroidia bacterium]|nr:DNA-directed RNA polymerase sigma-70 factor [Bacteroidia bacterium]
MDQSEIQELIDRSKHGDTKAFGLLVIEYQPLVFRLAFRLLGNENKAEDATQDIFIKVWLQINKYKPQYQFSTWIYKVTANLCYDRLRSMEYTLETDVNSCPTWVSSENIEAEIINKELSELILYFTKALSPKQKLVFTLNDIEGLETAEITAITGLPPEKIKSNLYLARKSIREKLISITG